MSLEICVTVVVCSLNGYFVEQHTREPPVLMLAVFHWNSYLLVEGSTM